MYKYQYKEKTYAEEILKNGFTSKHIRYELKILVKYYKHLGYKPKERKELIYKFCEEHLEGYNRVIHFKMINSVLSYGANKKNKLIEIENVPVTKAELDYIDSLEVSHDYKKVVFTLLILDKLSKKYHEIRGENKFSKEHYFGGIGNYKELVKSSKVPLKRNKQIHEIIGELDKKDIIKITGNGSIKLIFIYQIPNNSEIGLSINTFDNIGYYFDLYKGKNKVKKCECCGTLIKAKSNRHKYCEKCWNKIKREQTRERVKKHRMSNALEKRSNP